MRLTATFRPSPLSALDRLKPRLISRGTGSYEDLEGFGTGVGAARNGELIDIYTGRIGTSRGD